MLSFRKPSIEQRSDLLKAVRGLGFSYADVGCLDGETPVGFNRDTSRCWLGTGEATWQSAVSAFNEWCFMPSSMVEVSNAGPIEVDRIVGVLFEAFGVYSFNPARILEVHQGMETVEVDGTQVRRTSHGFTYGTLPGHVEKGEERFLLIHDHSTDQVWYEIEAVSRPNHLLAWVTYPYARMQQAKFRKLSSRAMLKSVMNQKPEPASHQNESSKSPV